MLLRNSSKQPVQIDGYKVLGQLGKGGFGIVYHVCDIKKTEDEYALKVLKRIVNVKRIQTHLETLKTLNTSKYFLKTYMSKKILDKYIILMEYTDKENLSKQAKKAVFSQERAIKVIWDILEVLEFLHGHEIIHGDVKTENLLQKNDRYYLIDYDVVKKGPESKVVHIQSDDDYTAPEIYRGVQTYSSDIYSLGCSIYELLTAQHIYAFKNNDLFSLKMFSHLYLKPKESSLISKKMNYLIARMTDKNHKTRASIQEVREIICKSIEKDVNLKDIKELEKYNSEYDKYLLMSNSGVSYAQNILGLIYEGGMDVTKDINKAFRWYKFSAQQGLVKAQFNLGLCYKNAKGCKQDYTKAMECFLVAAEQGHSRSFYILGKMHAKGLGVDADINKAKEYYKKAAINGYKKAYKKLKELL